MAAPIPQAIRDEVARLWRASYQAQCMAADQADQVAERVRNGSSDALITRYLGQTRHEPQEASTPAPATLPDFFGFPPMMPMPVLPMPPLFAFPPMSDFINSSSSPTPLSLASAPGTDLKQEAQPQISYRTFQIPGGVANQQDVNFSGRIGNVDVTYSSSSTSGRKINKDGGGIQMPLMPMMPNLPDFAPDARQLPRSQQVQIPSPFLGRESPVSKPEDLMASKKSGSRRSQCRMCG